MQPRGGEQAPPLAPPHDAARHLGAHPHERLRGHADAPVDTERLDAPAVGAKLDEHHQHVGHDARHAEARVVDALLRPAPAEQGASPAAAAAREAVLQEGARAVPGWRRGAAVGGRPGAGPAHAPP